MFIVLGNVCYLINEQLVYGITTELAAYSREQHSMFVNLGKFR